MQSNLIKFRSHVDVPAHSTSTTVIILSLDNDGRVQSPPHTAIPRHLVTGNSNTGRCLTYTRRNECRLYTEVHILAIFSTCKKLLYASGGMHPPLYPPLDHSAYNCSTSFVRCRKYTHI